MKYSNIFFFIISCIFFLSCKNKDVEHLQNLFSDWENRKILFPKSSIYTIQAFDTVKFISKTKIKLLYYVDSVGCSSCKMKIEAWRKLMTKVETISNENIDLIMFVHPKNKGDAKFVLRQSIFPYPVCIDLNDSLNKLNHFPSDERFHCFLLDENNKVILIGNPVQNPKIKELYIRTICERLGIDTTNINNVENQKNRFSFGRFPFSETMKTQFVLRNDSLPELMIDTIFTSCECTTAKIDKSLISRNDSAIISVTFKTDKPEEFTRDVYVKTNLSEKPIVYTVEGMAY